MRFSINSPKSERFFQLSFEGFRPKGQNKIEQLLELPGQFAKAVVFYVKKKLVWGVRSLGSAVLVAFGFAVWSKNFLVRKLIWSRGRLGRPIANMIVMSVAFLVFLFGEVFNSSKLVNSQEINPDYLSNVTDIIPKRNVALTTLPDSRKQTESFVYIVEGGDTLSAIGNKFKISTDALRYVNNLADTDYLKVGQELVIPPVSGLIHSVESGDSLSSIAAKYNVAPQAIADFNYILDVSTLAVGTELVIPGAEVPQPKISIPAVSEIVPVPIPFAGDTGARKDFCVWPSSVRIITQYFSWYHNGIDIATPWGAMPPLYACTSGVVTRAGWDPWGLGLHVQIDHGNGYQTVYGHMSRIDVGYGVQVSRGQAIGLMGNTGRSTGPHVHFMVKYHGVPQNPLNYMR
jgi:murein DD-endopeptidase MepM/ murein hydrolase activator NlpD